MRLQTLSPTSTRRAPATIGAELPLPLVFAIAFGITGLPIFLHVVSQPLALAVCAAMAFAAAWTLEPHVPVIVLTANIFQNIFVALVSVNYVDVQAAQPLKSYNFVTTVVVWFAVMSRFFNARESYSPFVRRMIYVSTALLAVYGVYFVGGLAINPRNSIIYLRNVGLPILMFQMFLLVAARHRLALPRIVAILLGLLIAAGYLEVFDNNLWLDLTNGWHYLSLLYADRATSLPELKAAESSGHVAVSLLDYSKINLFNSSLFARLHITVQRLQGPNFHSISFGYLLAALLPFAAIHRRGVLALLAAPLLVMTNAKGPLLLAIFTLAYCGAAHRWNPRLALKVLLVALAVFAVFVFRSGLATGNYHVLGLLGGVHGFLRDPLGHTLGQGGNLSIPDFAALNWSKFQHQGAADVAVESAVGVMLFQLGVASIPAFAFYVWIARTALLLYERTRAPALAFAVGAIAVTMVNGLFQEEAYFAPLALALVMGLVGLSLGATDRVIAASPADPDVPAPTRRFTFEGRGAGRFARPAAMRR